MTSVNYAKVRVVNGICQELIFKLAIARERRARIHGSSLARNLGRSKKSGQVGRILYVQRNSGSGRVFVGDEGRQWAKAREGARICQGCHTRAQIYRAAAVLRAHKVPLSLASRELNALWLARVYKHVIPSCRQPHYSKLYTTSRPYYFAGSRIKNFWFPPYIVYVRRRDCCDAPRFDRFFFFLSSLRRRHFFFYRQRKRDLQRGLF